MTRSPRLAVEVLALVASLVACSSRDGTTAGGASDVGGRANGNGGSAGSGGTGASSAGAGAGTSGTGGSFGGSGGNAGSGASIGGAGIGGASVGSAGAPPCTDACTAEAGSVCSTTLPSRCTHPSCAAMNGTECNDGGDCCASPLVTGGTFTQGPDQVDGTAFQSTVASFRLDKYEVTVARFRAFASAYDAWHAVKFKPASGDGADPNVTGSGWDSAWSVSMPASSASLVGKLGCNFDPTWAPTSGNDTLPMNCVDWFEAFAFCIWDGGRLPTEAEWEYAAAGGSNDWTYPWGNAPAPTGVQDDTSSYALYHCLGDGSVSGTCAFGDILTVGSKTAGRGSYGQDDLAGSVDEWTLDWYAPYPTAPSTNYADLSNGTTRTLHGGDWLYDQSLLARTYRNFFDPTIRNNYVGFRCARSAD